jgi:hypothetical protein
MNIIKLFTANKRVVELEKQLERMKEESINVENVYQGTLLYYMTNSTTEFNEHVASRLNHMQVATYNEQPVRSQTAYNIAAAIRYVVKSAR